MTQDTNAGTVIDGKYRIERQLGEGGMATVFAATHIHLNDRVAIKVLLASLADNPTVVERFMREARAAVRLKSEHVVRVIDVGTLPSRQPYIVMEFLDGTDLEVLLHKRGTLTPQETVDYVLQICEALAEAHAAGIVHRDIKPANCLLSTRTDGMPRIKVLDFGIAKLTLADAGPKLTATATTMGTPAFMSPEQIRGAKDVDHRGDIWSLGITLFELINGKVPFSADTYARLVMSVMRDPTPPLPGIPPGLFAVIDRCLAKERDHRYQNVAELAQALEPFAGNHAEAAVLVQRCVALARPQQPRPAAGGAVPTLQPGMSPPAHGMQPMNTPAHGMQPMNTPAHGMQPMNTPAHGMPPTNKPGYGVPPMTTPAHGMQPMTTPAHGMPPTHKPGYGVPPMTTPAHGMQPMTTPAHGMQPMTTPAHGMQPMITPAHGMPPTNKPGYGVPPMTTPAHGMQPMTTPAHGMQPMTTPAHGMPPTHKPGYGVPMTTPAHGMPPSSQAPYSQSPYATHPTPASNPAAPAMTTSPSNPPTAPTLTAPRKRSPILWLVLIAVITAAITAVSVLLAGS